MSGKLLGRTVPVSGLTFSLGDTTKVGAATDSEVCVLAPGVADRHATIWSESGLVWLEDAGSESGTFLNGDRIVHKELLRNLDVISFGPHIDMIFVSRDETPAPDWIRAVSVELLGAGSGRRIEVPKGGLTFGRGSSCDVALPAASISRVHAWLQRTATQVVVQDLESANGTFVNGKRIEGPTALNHRDVVGLGGPDTFRVAINTLERLAGSAAAAEALAEQAQAPLREPETPHVAPPRSQKR